MLLREVPIDPSVGKFFVDSSTGQVFVNNVILDYETIKMFTVRIVVRDNGKPKLSSSAFIRIRVLDLNEPPVLIPKEVSFNENSPRYTQASSPIFASDPDEGQTLTFKLETNPGEIFTIEGCSGLLSLNKEVLNYEASNKHYVFVEVTDSGVTGEDILSDSSQVTIAVLDVNEPPVIVPAAYSITLCRFL